MMILPSPGMDRRISTVALPANLPRCGLLDCGAELVLPSFGLLDLLIDQADALHQRTDMGAGGFRGAERNDSGGWHRMRSTSSRPADDECDAP